MTELQSADAGDGVILIIALGVIHYAYQHIRGKIIEARNDERDEAARKEYLKNKR